MQSSLTGSAWAALALVWVAAIVSPGPDVFLLMRLAVRERRAAVLAALGIMTGNTIWVIVSVLGLTALITAQPQLIPVLQVAGSLVLAWIGVQSIRGGFSAMRGATSKRPHPPARRAYVLGFVTNIANPKAIIFFTALLTQFLPPSLTVQDRLGVIIMMIGSGLLWFVGVALACSVEQFRRWLGKFAPWLDIVAGLVFLLVAVVVLGELAFEFFAE